MWISMNLNNYTMKTLNQNSAIDSLIIQNYNIWENVQMLQASCLENGNIFKERRKTRIYRWKK